MKKCQIPLIVLLRWSLCFTGSIFILVSLRILTALQNLPMDDFSAHSLSVEDDEDWPHPFIHIVNTRFMQHQADLIELAKARLVLFDTFCLGSMLGQTLLLQESSDDATPPLLWIIKTDPDLNESLLKQLISLIKPYPFIYLVASNINYGIGIHPGGWRGGQAGNDVLRSKVYTGNMTLLRRAHAARETHGILETRLDADDGLHVHYLETIQNEALESLQYSTNNHNESSRPLRWMYWCPMNHLDWTPTPPFATGQFEDYGAFVPFRSSSRCITAGITLGVSVGQNESSLPRFMHHELYNELLVDKKRSTCNGETCLHMIEKPLLGAMRSRTATSAGMRDVSLGQEEFSERVEKHAIPLSSKHLVAAIEKGFNVSVSKTIEANHYMQQHVAAIAADNLRGQCTHGHSCKNSTREALEALLRAAATYTL